MYIRRTLMIRCTSTTVALFLLMLIFVHPVFSESRTSAAQGGKAKTILYKPPFRGKPSNRVGGGTRGTQNELPSITAIVPEHTGLTVSEQPKIFWHSSKPFRGKIEFTLNSEQEVQPVIEVSLGNLDRAGIQVLDLAKFAVRLAPGVEYQWFVAIVPDADYRSKDIVINGKIKRIVPADEMIAALNVSSGLDMPFAYASQGIWYDALSALSGSIKGPEPDASLAREHWKSLMKQADLPELEF